MINFAQRIIVPDSVLYRRLGDESVLLNLNTESYLSLDTVGTRMWELLTTAPAIQAAYEALLREFDVEADVLRQDLDELISQMLKHGLVGLTNRSS